MVDVSSSLCLLPSPFRASLLPVLNAVVRQGSLHALVTPSGECKECGIPLTTFRRCYDLHLSARMTAHLCITTYRSPQNEVLKLEVRLLCCVFLVFILVGGFSIFIWMCFFLSLLLFSFIFVFFLCVVLLLLLLLLH